MANSDVTGVEKSSWCESDDLKVPSGKSRERGMDLPLVPENKEQSWQV